VATEASVLESAVSLRGADPIDYVRASGLWTSWSLAAASVVAKIPVQAASIAVAPGAVWVANLAGTLFRIDPRTNLVTAKLDGAPENRIPMAPGLLVGTVLVVDGHWLWVVGNSQVAKVDTRTNHIIATTPTRGSGVVLDAAIGLNGLEVLQEGWVYQLATDKQ
jgi:hypothetical protein